eukprot:5648484-Pyramimonas_sp.AAC.1
MAVTGTHTIQLVTTRPGTSSRTRRTISPTGRRSISPSDMKKIAYHTGVYPAWSRSTFAAIGYAPDVPRADSTQWSSVRYLRQHRFASIVEASHREEAGRAVGESGKLDKAVRKGEGSLGC